MEIQGPNSLNPINRINEKKAVSPKEKVKVNSDQNESDAVEISLLGKFLSKLQGIPDIRVDKIKQIKTQIESGEYLTEDKFHVTVERLLEELM